jgi:hypothetical protein
MTSYGMRLASWGHGARFPWAIYNELHFVTRVRSHAITA